MNFTAIAPLFQTDAYKLGHLQQYGLAGNVTGVYSNYTNRGSRIADIGAVVHFGLQAFLERYTDSFRVFFDAEEDDEPAGSRRILATEPTHPYVGAWWPPGHGLGYEHGFTHQVVDLVHHIAEGTDPAPSFADGLSVQRVLAAVEASSDAAGSIQKTGA